jgi:hypothetical protein
MPVSVIHGKRGTVTIGSAVGVARNWTLNVTVDAADVSHFGTEWREFIPGLGSWTARVEALFDSGDAGLGAAQNAVFQTPVGGNAPIYVSLVTGSAQWQFGGSSPSKTYSGSGLITGYSHTTDVGDAQVVTLDIQGTGALNIT